MNSHNIPNPPEAPQPIESQLLTNLTKWKEAFEALGPRIKVTSGYKPEGSQTINTIERQIENPGILRPHPQEWSHHWLQHQKVALIVHLNLSVPSPKKEFTRDKTWFLFFRGESINLGDNNLSKTAYIDDESDEPEDVGWHVVAWQDWNHVFDLCSRWIKELERQVPAPPE